MTPFGWTLVIFQLFVIGFLVYVISKRDDQIDELTQMVDDGLKCEPAWCLRCSDQLATHEEGVCDLCRDCFDDTIEDIIRDTATSPINFERILHYDPRDKRDEEMDI